MQKSQPLISIAGISKSYLVNAETILEWTFKRDRSMVFKDVSLNLYSGRIIGFTGPNGCGKTTLLKIISGLYHPNEGAVFLKVGQTKRNVLLCKSIFGAYYNQETALFGRLTGMQNIHFFKSLYGGKGNKEHIKDYNLFLDILQLRPILKKCVFSYSSGMRERLGYAVSYAHAPSILIYDDFGKNIDRSMMEAIIDFSRQQLRKKKLQSVILSSTKETELKKYTDDLYHTNQNHLQKIV